jgi:hypothetical protein
MSKKKLAPRRFFIQTRVDIFPVYDFNTEQPERVIRSTILGRRTESQGLAGFNRRRRAIKAGRAAAL